MKAELIEKPRPPEPPPEKELVLRLSEEEARLLRSLLEYFKTTARPAQLGVDDASMYVYEVKARRKLRTLFADDFSDHLAALGINMVYGLNNDD